MKPDIILSANRSDFLEVVERAGRRGAQGSNDAARDEAGLYVLPDAVQERATAQTAAVVRRQKPHRHAREAASLLYARVRLICNVVSKYTGVKNILELEINRDINVLLYGYLRSM